MAIYLIQCRRCGLQYVGETRQPLHNQMNCHCFNIAHGRTNKSSVAAHFTSEGHTETDLSVMIIDRCWKEDTTLRKIRESRWIRTLDTALPSGMNYRTNCLFSPPALLTFPAKLCPAYRLLQNKETYKIMVMYASINFA